MAVEAKNDGSTNDHQDSAGLYTTYITDQTFAASDHFCAINSCFLVTCL